MSTEEQNQAEQKIKEAVEAVEETVEKVAARAEKAVEQASEAAEKAVEEVSEVAGKAAEQVSAAAEKAGAEAKASATQILGKIMDLKQNNPKVFYGAIGGVVVLLIGLSMFGGNPEVISKGSDKQLVVGQSYVLRTPNSVGDDPQVRLVSTPGETKAYDDTEETDREGCKNVDAGTPAIVKNLFDAYGKKGAFAEVEITGGPCQGKKMWTLSVNVTQQ